MEAQVHIVSVPLTFVHHVNPKEDKSMENLGLRKKLM